MFTASEQAIIDTMVFQASKQPVQRVQKLIDEIRRRIDNKMPIPAGGINVRPEVAEAVIVAIQPYAK